MFNTVFVVIATEWLLSSTNGSFFEKLWKAWISQTAFLKSLVGRTPCSDRENKIACPYTTVLPSSRSSPRAAMKPRQDSELTPSKGSTRRLLIFNLSLVLPVAGHQLSPLNLCLSPMFISQIIAVNQTSYTFSYQWRSSSNHDNVCHVSDTGNFHLLPGLAVQHREKAAKGFFSSGFQLKDNTCPSHVCTRLHEERQATICRCVGIFWKIKKKNQEYLVSIP